MMTCLVFDLSFELKSHLCTEVGSVIDFISKTSNYNDCVNIYN